MGKNNVIAFMNMKGGVCKTTLCVNIAHTLAKEYNKKILVIDMDPQFNATQYVFNVVHKDNFLKEYENIKSQNKTIYNLYDNMDQNDKSTAEVSELPVLFNTRILNNQYLTSNYISNITENLDFIVGDIRLVNLQIIHRTGRENVLEQYIDVNNLRNKYDYILIDSPPTYSAFFMSSYIACDTYIVPLKPDFVAALGLSLLDKGIRAILNTGVSLKKCLGLVYTLIDTRNTVHESICSELNERYKGHIFQKSINYYSAIPSGIEKGKFMADIQEHEIGSTIKNITEEFIARLGRIENE